MGFVWCGGCCRAEEGRMWDASRGEIAVAGSDEGGKIGGLASEAIASRPASGGFLRLGTNDHGP